MVNLTFSEQQDCCVHCFSLCPPFTSLTVGHLRVLCAGVLSSNVERSCKGFLYPYLKCCSFVLFCPTCCTSAFQGGGRVSQPSLEKLPFNQWNSPWCRLSSCVCNSVLLNEVFQLYLVKSFLPHQKNG